MLWLVMCLPKVFEQVIVKPHVVKPSLEFWSLDDTLVDAADFVDIAVHMKTNITRDWSVAYST